MTQLSCFPDDFLFSPSVPLSVTPSFVSYSPCLKSLHSPLSALISWLPLGIWLSASPTWWIPGLLICTPGKRSLRHLESSFCSPLLQRVAALPLTCGRVQYLLAIHLVQTSSKWTLGAEVAFRFLLTSLPLSLTPVFNSK